MSDPSRGLLDTSTLVLLGELDDPSMLPDEASISAITLAELSVGPLVADDARERAARQAHLQQAEADFDPLPFDAAAARAFGGVAASLWRTGHTPVARAYDALIAATAIALVDAPGRLDLDMLLDREHRVQVGALLLGEQAGTDVQGTARSVERVASATAVLGRVLLERLSAPIQSVAGEADDVGRVHHGDRVGQIFGGDLEPAEPVHRYDLDPLAPLLGAGGEPLLEHGLRVTLDHLQQPCRARLVAGRGQVDDHRDVLVTESV